MITTIIPEKDDTQLTVKVEDGLVTITHPNGQSFNVSAWKDAFVIESATPGTQYFDTSHTSSSQFELRIVTATY